MLLRLLLMRLCIANLLNFYRAMHFSALRGKNLHCIGGKNLQKIASVCNVGDL